MKSFATICFLMAGIVTLHAQTVTIYRSGIALTPIYGSVKSAAQAAVNGDSLVLSAHLFAEKNITINKSLSLTGTITGTARTTINAYKDSTVLNFLNPLYPSITDTLRLKDIEICNGFARNSIGGGGIYADWGTLIIIEGRTALFGNEAPPPTITSPWSSPDGGAVYSKGDMIIRDKVQFYANRATAAGGGIFCLGSLIIEDSASIYSNRGNYGGGIYSYGSLTISDSVSVNGNYASKGSGVYGKGTILIKNHASIISNLATTNGGGIYGERDIFLKEHAICTNNKALNTGGGIYSSGNLYLENDAVVNGDSSLNEGGGVYCIGTLSASDQAKISHNYATQKGGGIYGEGDILLQDSVLVALNHAKDGAGIYAFQGSVSLKNRVVISENSGRGVTLFISSLTMQDSAVIALNACNDNYAVGIYNKGGTIDIIGGQIIGNYSYYDTIPGKGMAIYNDTITGIPAPVVKINNARIFNPTSLGKRTVEVFNVDKTVFTSDSTWWGESDTTGLIVNEGSASTTLNSWIIANWSLNKGVPVGTAKSFPVEAYFTLNSGTAIPAHMFWMLKGLYTCDSGSFTPDTADMTPANIIASTYTAPWTTRLNTLLATVDADTLFNTLTVTGLPVKESRLKQESFSVYPNPSNGSFVITYIQPGKNRRKETVQAKVYDLLGRVVYQEQLNQNDDSIQLRLKAPNGPYIVELTEEGSRYRERIEIKN